MREIAAQSRKVSSLRQYNELSLESLLGSENVSGFLSDVWQSGCSSYSSSDRSAIRIFADLLDLDALAVRVSGLPPERLRVVKIGGAVPRSTFTTGEGEIRFRKVGESLKDGHSLVFNRLQLSEPAVARACRDLALSMFGHGILIDRAIGANLYVTGPSSQCFPRHRDIHDVFVLQLKGRKKWTVLEPLIRFPSADQHGTDGRSDAGTIVFDDVLSEGQVLYVPKGFPHEVITTDVASIHLTLSLYPVTWLDIIAPIMRQSSSMQTAIPRTSVIEGVLDAAEVRRLMGDLVDEASIKTAIARRKASFVPGLSEIAGDWISSALLGEEQGNALFIRNEAVVAQVIEENSNVTLQYSGGEFTADRAWNELFCFLAKSTRFRIDEVPGGFSENVDSLLDHLVQDGLFRRG